MVSAGYRGGYRSNRELDPLVLRGLLHHRRETPGKTENILERIVQRHRRYPKNIRLSPVAHHAFSRQPYAQRASVLVDSDGKLRPALVWLARRDDGEFLRDSPVHPKLV